MFLTEQWTRYKYLGNECIRRMWDMVTKSDRWVSSGRSGFLPHEDDTNTNSGANNEHNQHKSYA